MASSSAAAWAEQAAWPSRQRVWPAPPPGRQPSPWARAAGRLAQRKRIRAIRAKGERPIGAAGQKRAWRPILLPGLSVVNCGRANAKNGTQMTLIRPIFAEQDTAYQRKSALKSASSACYFLSSIARCPNFLYHAPITHDRPNPDPSPLLHLSRVPAPLLPALSGPRAVAGSPPGHGPGRSLRPRPPLPPPRRAPLPRSAGRRRR